MHKQIPYINLHSHIASNTKDIITVQSCHLHDCTNENLPTSYFSLGLHPWFANEMTEDEIFIKLSSVENNPFLLSIGEIGLDKARLDSSMPIQYKVFEQQLLCAEQISKPVIIHNVRCTNDILQAIKRNRSTIPVIFHGFIGKYQTAVQIVNSGAYLSFGKALLNHQHTRETLKDMPIDRFFLETDDSNCEIEDIYNCASTIKGMSVDRMKEICFNNFQNVFKI